MKLIPKSINVPSLGDTESIDDPDVLIKFFHPCSSWTWYVTEYSEEDNLCFGLIDGHEIELGYFSMDELSSLKVRGLPIERDLYWKPMKLSELKERLKNR
ncbi:DUF2958 domain-containing protein [Halobacteriovorax sp. JY17]|uniref:DUF2958 domain-containing protein n=1 Tax=Halobacteriovorax sp. JY17 TaxID=2014617 RepID=UPI000C43DE07|nr:DUF2958 domain-containing protein [Halobacteriovorax sp. JY17]PIK15097.1 MAG: hypothetical protein CES88_12245 [Halobacteriovorax sp. JY17]